MNAEYPNRKSHPLIAHGISPSKDSAFNLGIGGCSVSRKDKRRKYIKQWRLLNRKKIKEYHQEYRLNNKDKWRTYFKTWRDKYPGKQRARIKTWRLNNREPIIKYINAWNDKNKEKVAGYKKNLYLKQKSNSFYSLSNRMRWAIGKALRHKKNGKEWESLVGYTVESLKTHIESKFNNGMNWKLLNEGKIHIDHIIPISFFKYTKPTDQEFQYCWSLDNLQPLLEVDNLKKGNRINQGDK